jgi:hypothetical protein
MDAKLLKELIEQAFYIVGNECKPTFEQLIEIQWLIGNINDEEYNYLRSWITLQ